MCLGRPFAVSSGSEDHFRRDGRVGPPFGPGLADIEHFGPPHDVAELEAAEGLGMPGDHLPEDPRVRHRRPAGVSRLRFGQMRS